MRWGVFLVKIVHLSHLSLSQSTIIKVGPGVSYHFSAEYYEKYKQRKVKYEFINVLHQFSSFDSFFEGLDFGLWNMLPIRRKIIDFFLETTIHYDLTILACVLESISSFQFITRPISIIVKLILNKGTNFNKIWKFLE